MLNTLNLMTSIFLRLSNVREIIKVWLSAPCIESIQIPVRVMGWTASSQFYLIQGFQ